MIVRAERDFLAEQIRRLVEGQITNDEFFRARPDKFEDTGVAEIWMYVDSFLSDASCYRLTGRNALPQDVVEKIQRCIIFLRSDMDYAWPSLTINFCGNKLLIAGWFILFLVVPLGNLLYMFWTAMVLLVFGISFFILHFVCQKIVLHKKFDIFQRSGDLDAWPFLRKADYLLVLAGSNDSSGRRKGSGMN